MVPTSLIRMATVKNKTKQKIIVEKVEKLDTLLTVEGNVKGGK